MSRFVLRCDQGTFALESGENLAGSNLYCQVCLTGRKIAGEHARLDLSGDTVIVTPLVDGLDTLLNGKRIDGPASMEAGDTILVGRVELTLSVEAAALDDRG